MKSILTMFFLALFVQLSAQTLKSPEAFLGYELGSRFTRHHQVVDYYNYIATNLPQQVKVESYGETNEGRPLFIAILSTADNMTNLEAIRVSHLKDLETPGSNNKAIVWLSYNVHGNESVSTEASMQTIYDLLTSKKEYLENTVVIIDPCINPDGRDRYVNWYNQFKNSPFQVDPNSAEHHEGWWSGRSNHYMFDLNRDWAWLTQIESQQRLKKYNLWMPHIHVDFHEQGVDSPYYFAPAAEPYHEVITDFQRSFQETIGKNHAKYFDANGWFFFTKEVFDLFYPSYGDTYPTYNGAIGMTYEQGGSGRAGLGIINTNGDTLTLKDRIAHHLTTGLSTVEMAATHAPKLNEEFRKFYNEAKSYTHKSYALKGSTDRINTLASLFDKHQIKYGISSGTSAKGFNYQTGQNGQMRLDEHTLVVSVDQPKGTLVKVLLDPEAQLSDSLTYDITAWSLPYAYGLESIASETLLSAKMVNATESFDFPSNHPMAFLGKWNDLKDAQFLADALKSGIRVRRAARTFSLDGKKWDRGTLIITQGDNRGNANFETQLESLARHHNRLLVGSASGFVDQGKDFGSRYVAEVKPVNIAILSGEPTSTLRFGEIWHFMEQQLKYPITVLDESYFDRVDLNTYDVLILPDGYGYSRFLSGNRRSTLANWVRQGGKLVAMGQALGALQGDAGFSIERKAATDNKPEAARPEPFEGSEREQIKNAITGAIFKARVDPTHPLAFGYGSDYFTLKLGSDAYRYLDGGTVAYLERDPNPVSGFAGSEALKDIPETLVFGAESMGRGQVIYFVDNPLFRGFWENGKLFFANALFMLD
ncbi:M14 family metallopeptidase [Robiginitalea sp.]|nr:M14 family metallopeptidase [Robiginitalea sp.]